MDEIKLTRQALRVKAGLEASGRITNRAEKGFGGPEEQLDMPFFIVAALRHEIKALDRQYRQDSDEPTN